MTNPQSVADQDVVDVLVVDHRAVEAIFVEREGRQGTRGEELHDKQL